MILKAKQLNVLIDRLIDSARCFLGFNFIYFFLSRSLCQRFKEVLDHIELFHSLVSLLFVAGDKACWVLLLLGQLVKKLL
jgi:hypothetical protein